MASTNSPYCSGSSTRSSASASARAVALMANIRFDDAFRCAASGLNIDHFFAACRRKKCFSNDRHRVEGASEIRSGCLGKETSAVDGKNRRNMQNIACQIVISSRRESQSHGIIPRRLQRPPVFVFFSYSDHSQLFLGRSAKGRQSVPLHFGGL